MEAVTLKWIEKFISNLIFILYIYEYGQSKVARNSIN